MKNKLTSKVMCALLIVMMLLTLLPVFAFAANKDMQMLKKTNTEYMIYISDLLDENFEFAFSNDKESKKDTLEFKDSAKDKTENGKSIAYVDDELYNKYFNEKNEVFIWAKQNDKYIVEAQNVDLSKALVEEEIQDLNKVTKKISVKPGEKVLPEEIDENGVKITRKKGTLEVVNPDANSNYQYALVKAEPNTDNAKLITLAKKLNELEGKNMYEKLNTYEEFKNLYEKLEPKADWEKWVNVNNYVIEEPMETKDGDNYLVWVKKSNDNEEVIDLQIMKCHEKNEPLFENREVVVKKTVKLPVTGDNIVPFVIVGIIVVAIIVLVVLKVRNNKKEASK